MADGPFLTQQCEEESTPCVPSFGGSLQAARDAARDALSLEYDDPDEFAGKAVLIVGGRSSGVDIARMLRGVASWVPPALVCPARSGVERAKRCGGERLDATRSGIRGALGTASSARDVEPAGAEPGRCPDLDGISSRPVSHVEERLPARGEAAQLAVR